MTATEDMTTPVTRGELREELATFEGRIDGKLEKLEARMEARFDHKLEMWGGALLARIQGVEGGMQGLNQRVQALEHGVVARIDATEKRLLMELARYTRAVEESMWKQISVIDEKYTDLPPRVGRLETAVFPSDAPEPPRRRHLRVRRSR